MNLLGIADVRANIRDLRNAGIEVLDRWVKSRGRETTYKEYYVEL